MRSYTSDRVYCRETDSYISIYSLAYTCWRNEPLQPLPKNITVTLSDYNGELRHWIFGDSYAVTSWQFCSYVVQCVTLYVLGATVEELHLNNTRRILDVLDSLPYNEIKYSYRHRSDSFTILISNDYIYCVPTWYYLSKDDVDIKHIKEVGVKRIYTYTDIPDCLGRLQFFTEHFTEFKIPMETLKEYDLQHPRAIQNKLLTLYPEDIINIKCTRKDWKQLHFEFEVLLPSDMQAQFVKDNIKHYNIYVLEELNRLISKKNLTSGYFECSRCQYTNGMLYYVFAVKKEILDIIEKEGLPE